MNVEKRRNIKCSAVVTIYNGTRFLDKFIQNATEQTIFPNYELVLVHNEPSTKEMEIVRLWKERTGKFIKHIVVDKLESWGASINRGINLSAGELIALWNIDDLRAEASLEKQIKVLEDNKIGAVHGDFIISNTFGVKTGKFISHANFKKDHTRGMVIGPFFMWRKKLHKKVGFMDEQFISAADFCFAVRLAANTKIEHIPFTLGYYLDEGQGLSTKGNSVQPIERTVVEFRYGIIDKIEKQWIPFALKYNIRQILQSNSWIKINKLIPEYENFIRQNEK